MVRRIALFLLINFLIVITISIVLSLLGVQPYLTPYGLDIKALLIFCLIWGICGALISLALSRKIAKWLMRIQLVDQKGPYASLYQAVEKLSKKAKLPSVPEVGIFESSQMNAFATGPTKKRSLVAVSTGLMQKMNSEELEAVLAHEITHIANGDMVTMTLIQGVVNAFVMFLARLLAYAISFAGRSNERRSSYGTFYILTILFEIVFMILGTMVVGYFSRQREFRADRGGALLTQPGSMIGALELLKRTQALPKKSSISALMISMPSKKGLFRLFATHPPLEERIKRLEKMKVR